MNLEVDEYGVTVYKQCQGWFVFDVRKLLKLKGQETHEGNRSLKFLVKYVTMVVCDAVLSLGEFESLCIRVLACKQLV